MAKRSTTTATPRLRFPEFRNQAGFEPTPLGRAFRRITNGKANAQDHEEGGAFPLFDRSEVIKASSKFAFDAVAVILPGEGMSFRPRYFEGKFDLHQRAYALMQCQGQGKYFYYALDRMKADLALKAVKSTVLSLRLPIIEKFVVFAPSNNAEQQKIADCLTSLDEVIDAQGRKVEALKAHKRGLMQQLFPREGETRPRLRFPEFRDAPDWSNRLLGEAATFYNGRAYAKEELLERGKYRVLRVGNFFTNDHWYYSDLELEDSKYCDDGDLLYAWSASFGPRMWHGGKTIYHYHIWKVVENKKIDRAFLFYRLSSETEQMRAKAANGIGMFHITKGTIENWASSFPEIGEQQRIADCLSSLDTQITAETNQLAALKTHKQGLMQQLFPAPESD
ncbi:MAG TPA: restriction endonuclease subunit S [Gammaproteobacteria bacterium]|nr:restriction endonuclease subunit S [Gammaproteobacteria bacterium]